MSLSVCASTLRELSSPSGQSHGHSRLQSLSASLEQEKHLGNRETPKALPTLSTSPALYTHSSLGVLEILMHLFQDRGHCGVLPLLSWTLSTTGRWASSGANQVRPSSQLLSSVDKQRWDSENGARPPPQPPLLEEELRACSPLAHHSLAAETQEAVQRL